MINIYIGVLLLLYINNYLIVIYIKLIVYNVYYTYTLDIIYIYIYIYIYNRYNIYIILIYYIFKYKFDNKYNLN